MMDKYNKPKAEPVKEEKKQANTRPRCKEDSLSPDERYYYLTHWDPVYGFFEGTCCED